MRVDVNDEHRDGIPLSGLGGTLPNTEPCKKVRPFLEGPMSKGGQNIPKVDKDGFVIEEPRPPAPMGSGGSTIQAPKQGIAPGFNFEKMKKDFVLKALFYYQGNRTHASKALGISARTLQRWLKDWGIK